MSIGPFGGIAGSAGAPLSQAKGSETERSQQQSAAAERGALLEKKAAEAAGIGTTEEDQEATDRDADGRRFYEDTLEIESQVDETPKSEAVEERRASPPTTDEKGNTLDLTG